MFRRLAYALPPIRRLYERVDGLAAVVDGLAKELDEVRASTSDEAMSRLVGEHVEAMVLRSRLEAEQSLRDALVALGVGVEMDPELYLALENRFRGDAGSIEGRLEVYLPFVSPLARGPFPLVDLGAGRGEWLKLIAEHGIACFGVDENPAMVAEARRAGVEMRQASLFSYLEGAPDHSVGALTLFHVVEHLPFTAVAELFQHAERVLAPGGVLIIETPNAANVGVGASTFWVDPTHVRPLYPPLLEFLADRNSFERVQYLFLHPALEPPAPSDPPAPLDDAVARLWDAVFGPQDLGFLAWTANPDA